ncbi:hypothetical protein M0R45_015549 [Rubus argutus]|uniref:Uncharacterized protein n=1 Tax=Rubus argutus TaxID=59490 RepID=A0AAW1XR71_RUBAR
MARMSDPLVVGRVIGDVVDYFSPITTKPKVEVHGGDLRSFFTLVMTDPDVPGPSDPFLKEHLHCQPTYQEQLMTNLEGRKVGNSDSSSFKGPLQHTKVAEENEFGLPVAAVFFNAQRETAARRR